MWAGQPRTFGAEHPDAVLLTTTPTLRRRTVRRDACLTVGPTFVAEGEIGVQMIPGGEHAVLTFKGPYEGLGDAYRWLYGTWLPTSGREPNAAPAYEV